MCERTPSIIPPWFSHRSVPFKAPPTNRGESVVAPGVRCLPSFPSSKLSPSKGPQCMSSPGTVVLLPTVTGRAARGPALCDSSSTTAAVCVPSGMVSTSKWTVWQSWYTSSHWCKMTSAWPPAAPCRRPYVKRTPWPWLKLGIKAWCRPPPPPPPPSVNHACCCDCYCCHCRNSLTPLTLLTHPHPSCWLYVLVRAIVMKRIDQIALLCYGFFHASVPARRGTWHLHGKWQVPFWALGEGTWASDHTWNTISTWLCSA